MESPWAKAMSTVLLLRSSALGRGQRAWLRSNARAADERLPVCVDSGISRRQTDSTLTVESETPQVIVGDRHPAPIVLEMPHDRGRDRPSSTAWTTARA